MRSSNPFRAEIAWSIRERYYEIDRAFGAALRILGGDDFSYFPYGGLAIGIANRALDPPCKDAPEEPQPARRLLGNLTML